MKKLLLMCALIGIGSMSSVWSADAPPVKATGHSFRCFTYDPGYGFDEQGGLSKPNDDTFFYLLEGSDDDIFFLYESDEGLSLEQTQFIKELASGTSGKNSAKQHAINLFRFLLRPAPDGVDFKALLASSDAYLGLQSGAFRSFIMSIISYRASARREEESEDES